LIFPNIFKKISIIFYYLLQIKKIILIFAVRKLIKNNNTMNIYLVINNKAENRFIVCAENTERAYELARENGRENEVFDRSFFLSTSNEKNECIKEIKNFFGGKM